ncbi:MAG: MMPL family transporter [Gammaproteobacteria bacterium]|nr:MMPL family transporter [Gammaproteobacteria bacterium]MBQ0839592.1 MMPL family transporter [Gammaproteobacteria bacterium]
MIKEHLINFAFHHPKRVFQLMLLAVIVFGAMLPKIIIDTDPENMLPSDQADRVFHEEVKKKFGINDLIVVGMINEGAQGIYNPRSLEALHKLSNEILKIDGIVPQDVLSLATVDNISQDGPGTIRFQWMMNQPPSTSQAASEIRSAVENLPFLNNTIVSPDGIATAVYIPILHKDQSYRIVAEVEDIIDTLDSEDSFYITGLPVAEDTFGVEMFLQMATSAPVAGLLVFLLMWYFFRSLSLIASPMILAMVSIICTMGLLIGMGYTVHIMSSMIMIFLMPIAVVDSVHLLSEFSDRYHKDTTPEAAMREVIEHLYTPMLYTSLTSAIGFAALALTPIPPVQVFGLFIAFGVMLAFFLTITFIPAYVISLSPERLQKLAATTPHDDNHSPLARSLKTLGKGSLARPKILLLAFSLITVVSVIGVSKIIINDNPFQWFQESHRLRVADKILNQHFAGTYNAFLVLEQHNEAELKTDFDNNTQAIIERAKAAGIELAPLWQQLQEKAKTSIAAGDAGSPLVLLLQNLALQLDDQLFAAAEDQGVYLDALLAATDEQLSASKYFQQPEALAYIESLQQALLTTGIVGKSNSVTDVVKTVYRELNGGSADNYRIPDSSAAVAQTLLSYQSSHRPQDLWRLVTPDQRSASIWLQLKSGDNVDMSQVVDFVDDYRLSHPLPAGVEMRWAGLTYINVVWQEAMVNGMVTSLLGAFAVVSMMMIFLFRSILFGLLAMIPLSATILFIYGIVGWAGKDYDMPVAILSALSLGLSVDFAIHFVQRLRELVDKHGSFDKAIPLMFEQPARAISRNAIVIAIGFLPLLLSPLVPYNTVGMFLAAIMIISCLTTLVILPILMTYLKGPLFGKHQEKAQ